MIRLLLVLATLVGTVLCDQIVTVETQLGLVRGQHAKDGNYKTFFGVPYALVNKSNPFGNSHKYEKYPEIIDAFNPSIKCPQVLRGKGGIIQCLRLNIYVPDASNLLLPVLVWFHGGGFVMGSAGDYNPKHLVIRDIIVVTANYRLGPYGFFCLEQDGNQGIKDQVRALEWIKTNIEVFGGDPSRITIAGQSYGGGSVDLHLNSRNDRMYDQAIIQSGSAYSEGLLVQPDYKAPNRLAKFLGANPADTDDALRFLSQRDPIVVMTALKESGIRLGVCQRRLGSRYSRHRQLQVPVLIGYNSKENFKGFADMTDDQYAAIASGDSNIFMEKLNRSFVYHISRDMTHIVQKFYLGEKPIDKSAMLELSDFTSDVMLNRAVEASVNFYVDWKAPKVYKYLFSYVGGSKYKNVTGVGAYHTEELQYLFEMNAEPLSEEQTLIRNRMTTMWANFVKYGDPTPEITELLPTKWMPVTGQSRPYLNIDVDLHMRSSVYHHRMAFWELFWAGNWKYWRPYQVPELRSKPEIEVRF